ncbi:hypothetical protein JK359_35895 [Streptomyces actinomycinicus]|uniref:Uncharacterized protein n=1 Tax=Streptomyces actinomycinicus TaxID=1695166 RepID=A0A937JT04_9ACTN|nr:hypothetical protein [Streptomyces actinomycinicus]MBL1087282.1 hypothetical protein [Streptomyces actinomycinicus]
MTRLQRLALLAASTTVITGGALLPTAAFAAPSGPPAAATVIDPSGGDTGTVGASGSDAGTAAQWTPTTDEESGISIALPGEATAQSDPLDGREYAVQTEYGAVGFVVYDGAGIDPQELLTRQLELINQEASSSGAQASATNATETATDEGTQLDVDLVGGNLYGHLIYAPVDGHMLMIYAVGSPDTKDAIQADLEQLIDTVQAPTGGAGTTDDAPATANDSDTAFDTQST